MTRDCGSIPAHDEELERAFGFLLERQQLSASGNIFGGISYLQRRLRCGYNHAARLMDQMIALGWVTEVGIAKYRITRT